MTAHHRIFGTLVTLALIGLPGIAVGQETANSSTEPSPDAPKPLAQRVGLSLGPNATVMKEGRGFRGIGVNYFNCFYRTLLKDDDVGYEAGFAVLSEKGIPFVRFCATGFWPNDMKLYEADRPEYFRRLDGVVKSAEKHGVGLVPSLFWNLACIPDLVGEPMDQWANPKSKTQAWMREYVREVVSRYRDNPAIWAWEFGNEWSLAASLPNASENRPRIVAERGTPRERTQRDDLTYAMVRQAFIAFGKEVRKHDPHRLISTGDSMLRPSAWHQARELTWTPDTPAQYAEMLALMNPAPINAISLHAYEDHDIQRLAASIEVSRALKKPLFIGEFGAPGESAEQAEKFRRLLQTIVDLRVPLAAVWVFDHADQQGTWNITADNTRSWQLDAVAAANQKLARAK